ncbi:YchJ family protein [Streptomyces sp. NA02950]|uniref:YchJ family protein n=1 Tax=Streptomyces sp. NA02950 TaxID=2742137 RepID=UPI0015916834|nr:YchJ family protein [Streptomyces sp. NA02950]QKV96797.1 YchJ family protein [Streptomyces sp. NA02950]
MSRRKRPPRPPRRTAPTVCPCGLPAPYDECCGRLHRGEARAATAEQLMRSRYSAFAVGDEAYLLRSWHPSTRPPRVALDAGTRWTGLEILGTTDGTAFHSTGTVEFLARYTEGGRVGELHENSRFARHEGDWVYLDALTSG